MTNASQTPTIDELEYRGRRHVENLDGLHRTDAAYEAQTAGFEAEITDLTESLAHVPPSTDLTAVDATFQIKRRIVELERDRDMARHEQHRLQPQIPETVALIEDNTAAIEALKAKAGL